jgi:maleylacetoacetate isomerase
MSPSYELYSYFRSSCSARVRIAATYKGIPLEYKFIHLVNGEQLSPEYTTLSPSKSVPTLIVRREDGEKIVIRQSLAILEYLEESRPDLPPLMPEVSNPELRARVRELVDIVACDIQPVTNLRILKKVQPLGVQVNDWQQEFMTRGFDAYENLAKSYAGRYSIGDNLSMADVVLAPAVDGAIRFGIDINRFPTIQKIYQTIQELEAFKTGSWRAQGDTPIEFRPNAL